MCPMLVLEIAGGGVLLLVGIWGFLFFLDVIDGWTSKITDEEARRRAHLTFLGKWPPTQP